MYEHGLQEACLRPRSRRGNLAPGGRLAMAALLVLLAACPAPPPPPPPAVRPTPVRSAPAPLPDAQRVQALEQELAQLAGPVPASAERAYAWLAQRARDGDHGARTVQLVFGLRGALRTGCRDAQEKEGFAQQLALLRLHLGSGTAAERVFAGPTLLMGLKETGQQEEVLSGAFELAALTRDVYQKHPQRLGALLFDITHVLRRACHLKPALSLLEEAQPLLLGDPGVHRGVVLVLRRDLATLHFLFGDAPRAQEELARLEAELQKDSPAEDTPDSTMAARREVAAVLKAHLGAGDGPRGLQPLPPPRENGPGWQALRGVQEEASCPQAAPADPRLLRVPVPPPLCVPTTAELGR